MIQQARTGSLVLTMLFLITTMTVVLVSILRSQVHLIALSREREEYERNYNRAEALLRYGVQVYSEKKGHENQNEQIVRFDSWPGLQQQGPGGQVGVPANMYGIITIIDKKMVRAELKKNNTTLITLQMALRQEKKIHVIKD